MLKTLGHALAVNEVVFERFAFAYCKKDPKTLGGLRAYSWDAVDDGLRDILKTQLAQVVEGGKPPLSYDAIFGARPVQPVAHNLVRGVTQGQAAQPVGDLLKGLAATNPNLDSVKEAMGVLAAKYLAHPRTRTAVLCLVLFKLKLPQGGEREYCFMTLVDGEELTTIMVFEDENLVTKRLANVFREKKLTRGAIYPWSDQPTYNDQTVHLHVDRDADFWSEVLECRRCVATTAEQQGAVLNIAAEMGLDSSLMTQLKTVKAPVISGADIYAAAREMKQDLPLSSEQVNQRLQEMVPQGLLVKSETLETQKKDLKVVAGPGLEVTVAPEQLERVRQVRRGDRRFLVIDIDVDAVVTGGKGQTRLREVTWDDFIEDRG